MRMSKGVEAALHCCLVMHWLDGRPVASTQLANFFGLPPAYLQKTLRGLVVAGIASAVRGNTGGFTLARPADKITLMDVVVAVEGRDPAFRCDDIRHAGASGTLGERTGGCAIAHAMRRAEMSYRTALAAQTIANLSNQTDAAVRARSLLVLA